MVKEPIKEEVPDECNGIENSTESIIRAIEENAKKIVELQNKQMKVIEALDYSNTNEILDRQKLIRKIDFISKKCASILNYVEHAQAERNDEKINRSKASEIRKHRRIVRLSISWSVVILVATTLAICGHYHLITPLDRNISITAIGYVAMFISGAIYAKK